MGYVRKGDSRLGKDRFGQKMSVSNVKGVSLYQDYVRLMIPQHNSTIEHSSVFLCEFYSLQQ